MAIRFSHNDLVRIARPACPVIRSVFPKEIWLADWEHVGLVGTIDYHEDLFVKGVFKPHQDPHRQYIVILGKSVKFGAEIGVSMWATEEMLELLFSK